MDESDRLTDSAETAGGSCGSPSPLLFEIAWEVCAQAGGIYTVLRSKAPSAVRRWGNAYFAVGPYREASASIEFEPEPLGGPVGRAIQQLRERGAVIHSGRWLVTGRPQTILVDTRSVADRLDQMKYFLWKDIGIATPAGDWELDETIAFGYVLADLLQAVQQQLAGRPLIAHFHEWQAAVALPLLEFRRAHVPTVFTTHATLVGRSLSAANVDLYDVLDKIDAEAVACQHGFTSRFHIERAAARAATVFTTVSGITGLEAERFLGRKPDMLLPNGLNIERFAAPYQFQNLHRENKQRIHEFVMGHFFPSFNFELDRTLYFFTAGRYEYRNKGFDVFIEALHELNQRLKAKPSDITVVAFIIAPARYRSFNVESLNRQAMFRELRELCRGLGHDMGLRLVDAITAGRLPTLDDLLDEFAQLRLKRTMHAWRRSPLPTIVTHDLVDDASDPILCHLRHRGLINTPEDPVKVVFHPEFITATSPILGLEYDEFVRGCNLGVFPSYYEPWGYTPMECVVRGIPAITSDLSGFGAYISRHVPDHEAGGILVARRRGMPFAATVSQIADWLHAFTGLSRRQRIQLRARVEAYSPNFDWDEMARYYRAARNLALERVHNVQPSP